MLYVQEKDELVRREKEQQLAFARAVDQERLEQKMKRIEQQEKRRERDAQHETDGQQQTDEQQADILVQSEDGSDAETQSI